MALLGAETTSRLSGTGDYGWTSYPPHRSRATARCVGEKSGPGLLRLVGSHGNTRSGLVGVNRHSSIGAGYSCTSFKESPDEPAPEPLVPAPVRGHLLLIREAQAREGPGRGRERPTPSQGAPWCRRGSRQGGSCRIGPAHGNP